MGKQSEGVSVKQASLLNSAPIPLAKIQALVYTGLQRRLMVDSLCAA